MKIVLQREPFGTVNTKGKIIIYTDNGNVGKVCDTLELAWRDNKRDVSCLPPGNYRIGPMVSQKLGRCFAIYDTDPRTDIRIHAGNRANSDDLPKSDIEGCILAGFGYSTEDSIPLILNSRETLNGLLTYVGNGIYPLEIINAE